MNQKWRAVGIAVAVVGLVLTGCGGSSPPPIQAVEATPESDRSQTIILGDVDPDEPLKKSNGFSP